MFLKETVCEAVDLIRGFQSSRQSMSNCQRLKNGY